MRTTHLVPAFFLLLAACGGGDPCSDDAEPNDDRGAAQALTSGQALGGMKACVGDVDWFTATLAAGDELTVHLSLTSGQADGVILSAHEPANGAPIAAGAADGDGLTLRTQPGAAGTYAIKVQGLAAQSAYSVTATVAASPVQCGPGTHAQNGACVVDGCEDGGLEPNDTLDAPRRVAPGVYTGLQTCDGDEDYYVITAPPGGGALQVSITNIQGGDVDIYAGDGTMNGPIPLLRAAGQTTGDADHITNVPVPAGGEVYFFVVGQAATYDMEVSWTELVPERDCLTGCEDLILFDGAVNMDDPAAIAAGYFNGTEQAYLWGRRDFLMALAYSFKKVAEHFPNTNPVYVSDISQEDGDVPGVDVGQPRHPSEAHVNGHDADIAYYSTLGDNDYRIICGDGMDNNGNGQQGQHNDGYFCTTAENVLDAPRQAYFLAMMAENPLYHVTGIDETLPDQIIAAAQALESSGELPSRAVYKLQNGGLAFGNINLWPFHHHHFHIQFWFVHQPRLPLWYDTLF